MDANKYIKHTRRYGGLFILMNLLFILILTTFTQYPGSWTVYPSIAVHLILIIWAAKRIRQETRETISKEAKRRLLGE